MIEQNPLTLSRKELEEWMSQSIPNNEDPRRGYSLVNVLSPAEFNRKNIPESINIPEGRVDIFEERYSKEKDIIVYSASPTCNASAEVADELASRGFKRVYDYAAGMSDWINSGEIVDSPVASND